MRILLPNAITLLSLCAGLTAVRLGFEGRYDLAVIAIGVAAVLDGLDGRLARLMKGATRFGAELDSLSDFICFGCAPALILYAWSLHQAPTLGWSAALLFASAAALRLARFNVASDGPARPEWQKRFFVGVPAPAGALCALLPLNLTLSGLPIFGAQPGLVAIYVIGAALLMISRVPTLAGKHTGLRVPRNVAVFLLVGLVGGAAVVVTHPHPSLAALSLLYLAALPFGVRHHRALRERTQTEP
jgi:CDP-diacylglycerol--serine O-phosphatidyltransferase